MNNILLINHEMLLEKKMEWEAGRRKEHRFEPLTNHLAAPQVCRDEQACGKKPESASFFRGLVGQPYFG